MEKANMLASLTNRWFSYIEKRLTPFTVYEYRQKVLRYIQTINQNWQDANEIEKYITNLLVTMQNQTVNTHIATLKSFYRWVEKLGFDNPMTHIEFLKTDPTDRRVLTPDEYEQVLLISHGPLHDAIQFLGNTGLRETEFRNITWNSFVPDTTDKFVFVDIIGKGRKRRQVPLNDNCRELLHNPVGSRPEFVAQFQHRTSFYCACRPLAAKARIRPFGSHAIRHFFATRLINAGVPLSKVSRILGHASTAITEQVYVHLCQEDLQVTDCLEF